MTSSQLSRLQDLLGTSPPLSGHERLAAMEAETMPPPRTMHTPGPDDFNVDPNSPYLESGPNTATQPNSPTDSPSKRKGARFAAVVKRVMSLKKQKRATEEGYLPPTPAVGNVGSPPHGHQQHGSHSSQRGVTMGSAVPDASASPASSSHTAYTIHETPEKDESYDGTTAVDHHMLPIAAINDSPIYVEPRPSSDYAKMSSAGSTSSFSSYVTRVQKFFHDFNELPWVAERVTVDYVPGESLRHRQATTRPIQRPLHRPSSWYGRRSSSENPQFSIDPSTSSSPGSNPGAPVIPIPPPQHSPYVAATAPHVTHTPHTRSVHSPPPRKWEPAYPNGYVPHNEAASMAERYPGRSVHGLAYVPPSATPSSVMTEQV